MDFTMNDYIAPNATNEYREARERLYTAERHLLDQIEAVAQMRRALPVGPEVPDYEFTGANGPVRLSQLFDSNREPFLVMYHIMYWENDDAFCPMCSGWIDALNGVAPHISQRVNLVAASQAPWSRLAQWAGQRGWDRINLLSDVGTDLAEAIGARDADNNPDSTVAVFSKEDASLRHLYTMHPYDGRERGIDLLNPLWHVFDLTPAGRDDFYLQNDYSKPVKP
jgi:predicted dithiol-disulfide oxidoreductase (DUF899 family)